MAQQELLNVNVIKFKAYTVATLPSATRNKGKIVFCSNGISGSPTLVYSNGTNWICLTDGTSTASAGG